MSPQFISLAGDTSFLFIKRLDATLKTTAGISNDGEMGASKYDTFALNKTAKVYFTDGTEIDSVKIDKPNKALDVQGELNPGEPIDFKISLDSLDLKFSQLDKIEKAEVKITNMQTKESLSVFIINPPVCVVQSMISFSIFANSSVLFSGNTL